MLRVGITVGCAGALVAAAVLAVELRHTRRTPSPLSGSEPLRERLAVTVSRAGGMLIGAYLGGLLTIGAGGRLMMRVLAATSSEDVQGQLTEAEEIIGEVSVGGSVFLIFVVGMGASVCRVGALRGVAALASRPVAGGRLGRRCHRSWRGRAAIGSPQLSQQGLHAHLPGGPGRGAVPRHARALRGDLRCSGRPSRHQLAPTWVESPRGVSVLPFAMLLPAPPRFVAAVIGVLAGTVAPTLRSPAAPDHSVRPDVDGAGAGPGRTLVTALGGLGGLSVVVAAGQVIAL